MTEILEKQLVTTRGHLRLSHPYNNHDQNSIIILPGDLLFAFQSPHHQHTMHETLILRSLPALNTLLREIGGTKITQDEICDSFKFIGSCLQDWALDYETPWLRGIDIVHGGCMKVVNIFDDLTQKEPKLPKTLPRHAYLWLRPCILDPKTRKVIPHNKALVQQHQATPSSVVVSSMTQTAETREILDDLFAEPEDENKMLAELDDPWQEVVVQPALPAAAAAVTAEEKKQHPEEAEWFWQFVPVCSTHPDLQEGGHSVRTRDTDLGKRWFFEYRHVIYLGHMIERPNRIRARPLDSEIMQYTIYGPTGLQSRYENVMRDERHLLQSIEIDMQ